MDTYCVTFRIAEQTVNGKTASERRQRLIDNVVEGSDGFWDEPTSFFLVGSNLRTPDFAKKACAGLSAAHDLVFVFDPADMSAAYFGKIEYLNVLKSFFPLAKKVE